tara:strand:+ start:558 stop:668 length:111 start_codon:yes stop_codon:yes gene_type:complete
MLLILHHQLLLDILELKLVMQQVHLKVLLEKLMVLM